MQGLGVSRVSVYQRNVGILKQYGKDSYRLVCLRTLRQAGYEERDGKGEVGAGLRGAHPTNGDGSCRGL